MTEPIPIAVAVVICNGNVLIGRRPEGASLAGYWEFPGGKVHRGESDEAAAARECLEETGLAVRIGRLLVETCWQYENGAVRLRFFVAEPLDASAPQAPFRWAPLGELGQYAFPPANAEVLRLLDDFASRSGFPAGRPL